MSQARWLLVALALVVTACLTTCSPASAPAPAVHVTARLLPAEAGPITIRGGNWFTADEAPWHWRGATMFMLAARLHRGEDISAQISWMQAHGVNVARVFVSGTQGYAEWAPVYSRPFVTAKDYDATLTTLIDRFAAAGLRLELTVLTDDAWTVEDAAKTLQHVYDLSAGRWNVFVEWMNEPWVGNRQALVDALIARGIDRRGIPTAYGIQADTARLVPFPVADYVTQHLPRDLAHYAYNAKDLMAIRDLVHRPVVGDEPIGVIDPGKYPDWCDRGNGLWSVCSNGGGVRLTNTADHVGHFAICALLGNGCTLHTQAGLEGRAPGHDEPITNSVADAIAAVWKFIPAVASTCQYRAPHLSDWLIAPVVYPTGHAYAADCGHDAWLMVPLATGTGYAGANGWSIAERGPFPGLLHLKR